MAISILHSSWLMCLGVLLLITVLPESVDSHIAMLYPPPRGGFKTKGFDWKIHEFIGYEGFKYPCGGYDMGPNTDMEAGQLINVRFWTSELKDTKHFPPPRKISQARHGGGLCEFSLSNDGGKSFHVIGKYTKTCPDVIYEWPIRIPDNVPDCDNPGKCLFAWSWTAALIDQFYHNCADITLKGSKNGKLPGKLIQLYNFDDHPKKTFEGDGNSQSAGPGPNRNEVKEASRRKSL
ncbi:hypothetical protein BGZ76_007501 [Entomortierella beljakovae]|nr:hypothetical protein BGZ76_007501 [Entomortierella beljakovae]